MGQESPYTAKAKIMTGFVGLRWNPTNGLLLKVGSLLSIWRFYLCVEANVIRWCGTLALRTLRCTCPLGQIWWGGALRDFQIKNIQLFFVGWASSPSYKLGGLDAIGVNLSQNSSKISFPGRTWKCGLSGSAASKEGKSLPVCIPSLRLGTRQGRIFNYLEVNCFPAGLTKSLNQLLMLWFEIRCVKWGASQMFKCIVMLNGAIAEWSISSFVHDLRFFAPVPSLRSGLRSEWQTCFSKIEMLP